MYRQRIIIYNIKYNKEKIMDHAKYEVDKDFRKDSQ